MKFFAVLAAAAAMVATSHAAECTTAQVTALKNSPEYTTLNSVDCDSEPVKGASCDKDMCLSALTAVATVVPDCTINGANLQKKIASQKELRSLKCGQASLYKTPAPGTTIQYPECTDAQLAMISGGKDEEAALKACDKQLGTYIFAESESGKDCDKACLAALDTMLANWPKCTQMGSIYWASFESELAEKKNSCAGGSSSSSTGTSNTTAVGETAATSTAAPSAATTAPASTGPAATPAPTTSGSSASTGVSAAAAAVLAAVVVAVQH